MACTTTSILYLHSLEGNETGDSPQPFSVSVSFLGSLPGPVPGGLIPLQISVSLPSQYAEFTVPVLKTSEVGHAVSRDATGRIEDDNDMNETRNSIQSRDALDEIRDDVSIPFLPLPSTFSHLTQDSWHSLMEKIQHWLLNDLVNHSQQWLWGRDLFWVAFIAAYPSFPHGSWSSWDCRISMEGEFIQSWMDQSAGSNDMDSDSDSDDSGSWKEETSLVEGQSESGAEHFRADLWGEFQRRVSLCYREPLVAVKN